MESHLKPGWKLFLSTSWRKRELVNADKSAFKCLYPRDELETREIFYLGFTIYAILNFSQFRDSIQGKNIF